MTITRARADAPKTFPGQIASYAAGQDTEYQEAEIIIHTPQESTPVEYAQPKITFIRDPAGVNQPGEQSYTRP